MDRHLRILHSMDMNGGLHISAPSEPVLPIAAAMIVMPTKWEAAENRAAPGHISTNRYGSILEALHKQSPAFASRKTSFNVLKELRGDFMARLLFMTAWDAVKVLDDTYLEEADHEYRAEALLDPVPLEDIVHGLATLEGKNLTLIQGMINDICDRVRRRFPGHTNVRAWTHFTHFDVLNTRVQTISPEYLWYCWKRGVGIQMEQSQPGVDGIIPVFVGDLDEIFGDASFNGNCEEQAARHMTYIAWDTNREHEKNVVGQLAEPKNRGPLLEQAGYWEPLTERGFLSVLVDMNTSTKPIQVDAFAEGTTLRLWIAGLSEPNHYPCLDVLKIRAVTAELLNEVQSQLTDYSSLNFMPDPMTLESHQCVFEGDGDAPQADAMDPMAARSP